MSGSSRVGRCGCVWLALSVRFGSSPLRLFFSSDSNVVIHALLLFLSRFRRFVATPRCMKFRDWMRALPRRICALPSPSTGTRCRSPRNPCFKTSCASEENKWTQSIHVPKKGTLMVDASYQWPPRQPLGDLPSIHTLQACMAKAAQLSPLLPALEFLLPRPSSRRISTTPSPSPWTLSPTMPAPPPRALSFSPQLHLSSSLPLSPPSASFLSF